MDGVDAILQRGVGAFRRGAFHAPQFVQNGCRVKAVHADRAGLGRTVVALHPVLLLADTERGKLLVRHAVRLRKQRRDPVHQIIAQAERLQIIFADRRTVLRHRKRDLLDGGGHGLVLRIDGAVRQLRLRGFGREPVPDACGCRRKHDNNDQDYPKGTMLFHAFPPLRRGIWFRASLFRKL